MRQLPKPLVDSEYHKHHHSKVLENALNQRNALNCYENAWKTVRFGMRANCLREITRTTWRSQMWSGAPSSTISMIKTGETKFREISPTDSSRSITAPQIWNWWSRNAQCMKLTTEPQYQMPWLRADTRQRWAEARIKKIHVWIKHESITNNSRHSET